VVVCSVCDAASEFSTGTELGVTVYVCYGYLRDSLYLHKSDLFTKVRKNVLP